MRLRDELRPLACVALLAACSSGPPSSTYDFGSADAGHHHVTGDGARDGGVQTLGPKPDAGGLTASCPQGDGLATVTGTVYDPAGKNPIYDVQVYVPSGPLAALPRGVPTGADACQCTALYPTAAYASTSTAVDGTFTLTGVPIGTSSLVLQIGKWRRRVPVKIACADTKLADRTLTLPATVAAGDTDDNMPDIAVSTGAADSLECLLLRMGVAAKEYVPGASTEGHVHIFAGGSGPLTSLVQEPGGHGAAELPAFPGAPPSPTSLWASASQLMPFDLTLLSCEGFETYEANPPALETYLNAGGRVFASHFHYAWFGGPIASAQSYSAPADWGDALGTWSVVTQYQMSPTGQTEDEAGVVNLTLIGGKVEPTLNDGSGVPFSKGQTMQTWLTETGALGQGGVSPSELAIYDPRYNVKITPANKHSQPWLTADDGADTEVGATMYFSFNTPIDAPTGPNVQAPAYCGRAVYSDLHVGGSPTTVDSAPPPSGCDPTELSAQEKALEFMLFDLSACVTDDALPIPDAGTVIIPPLR